MQYSPAVGSKRWFAIGIVHLHWRNLHTRHDEAVPPEIRACEAIFSTTLMFISVSSPSRDDPRYIRNFSVLVYTDDEQTEVCWGKPKKINVDIETPRVFLPVIMR